MTFQLRFLEELFYLTESQTNGRSEVYTGFWWGDLRERVHLEDPGLNGKIIQGVPILVVQN